MSCCAVIQFVHFMAIGAEGFELLRAEPNRFQTHFFKLKHERAGATWPKLGNMMARGAAFWFEQFAVPFVNAWAIAFSVHFLHELKNSIQNKTTTQCCNISTKHASAFWCCDGPKAIFLDIGHDLPPAAHKMQFSPLVL